MMSLVLGIAIGSVYIPPGDVVGILGHRLFGLAQGSWSESTEAIVWDVRLPRVLLALCVWGLAWPYAVWHYKPWSAICWPTPTC